MGENYLATFLFDFKTQAALPSEPSLLNSHDKTNNLNYRSQYLLTLLTTLIVCVNLFISWSTNMITVSHSKLVRAHSSSCQSSLLHFSGHKALYNSTVTS